MLTTTISTIITVLAIVISIGMFFSMIDTNRKQAKKELLDKLFKEGDITEKTYKKYLD